MPHAAPFAAPSAADDATINRRITVRHAGGVDTEVSLGDDRLSPFQKVRIHDISQGGVSLILPRAPAIGDTIFLQMTNSLLEFTYDLAAEVRHTTPHGSGAWLVGLEFEQPLSADELDALI